MSRNLQRQMNMLDIPTGDLGAFKREGGKIKLYDSGGGAPSETTQTVDLPDWAKGYAKDTLAKTAALTDVNTNPYKTYGANRIAGFQDLQNKSFTGAGELGTSGQLGTATNLAGDVGTRAMGTNYQAGQFANQFQDPGAYQPGQFSMMQAQAPSLEQYQMGPAERVRTQSFARPGSAEAFMSPYMQNVVDIQQREAQRQADIAGTQRGAQAVKSGAFGGSRQAIMEAEAARNLAQQKGDIQATGLQSAYGQAQQQFNAEQQARLQAQLANQQAGLTVGGQNLGARLGVQQLGAGQNLQSQLANQQAFQQAQQAAEQSRQFGAGQGLQAAGLGAQYGQAAQQLGEQSRQYGAGLGLQGLQTGLQAAGQLGQLGQTQFGQQKDIIGVQNQLGQQQQAQAQRPLDQAYQDFLNQQNYPYKQLGFMSDMVRGLPLGQQSTSQIYQAPPSFLQTAGSLGMGAYGLSQLAKGAEGGLTQTYADGGAVKTYAGDQGSVTSEYNIADIIKKLSPEQLQQAKETALNRRDVQTVEMIDRRLAELAQAKSLSAGLGSAFDQIEPERQEAMMAGGGIVAFADRGAVVDPDELTTDAPTEVPSVTYQQYLDNIANAKYEPMTTKAYNEAILARRKALEDGAGPNPYADYESKFKNMEAEDAKGLNQAKGLAALQAAGAMLQGSNAIRGLGAAGSAFAGAYGDALQANKAQKRSMMSMRMNLEDAQRKERMGLTRDAISAADQARKDHMDEQMYGIKKAQAIATAAKAIKPTTAKPNFDIESRDVLAADLKTTTPMKKGETEEQYDKRLKAMATREIYGAKGTKDITSNVTSRQVQDKGPDVLTSTAEGTESKEISDGVKYFEGIASKFAKTPDDKVLLDKYKKAAGGDMAKAARMYAEDTRVTPKAATSGTPAPAPAPAPAALPPAALAQLKEGVVTTFANGQQWKLQNGKPVKVK